MTRAIDRRHSVTTEGQSTWRVSWVGAGYRSGYTVHLHEEQSGKWLRCAWFSGWPDVTTYLDAIDLLDLRPLRERFGAAREAVCSESVTS